MPGKGKSCVHELKTRKEKKEESFMKSTQLKPGDSGCLYDKRAKFDFDANELE